MSENVFWAYNGWAILITILGPIYSIIQAESKMYGLLLRNWLPFFWIASIVLLFVLSNWITAVLYIPCWILGIILASIVKHRGLG
jgi:hypothetical protein